MVRAYAAHSSTTHVMNSAQRFIEPPGVMFYAETS
jgi:hypothetical protein